MRRIAAILTAVVVLAAVPAWASNHDLTVHQFFLPASATSGWRVHTSASTMNVTIQGAVNAAGGYKAPLVYAHPNYALVNSSNVSAPIAGSAAGALTGTLYHRIPSGGSVIGVAIQASTAITQGAAHVEATVLRGGSLVATGLTAVIGASLASTQYASATQARGADRIVAGEGVGCRWTTDSSMLPTSAFIVCTVHIEY